VPGTSLAPPGGVQSRRLVLLVVALAGLATGCTGIELPALGAAALSAGMGNVVRAGTEYTMTGTAYRTFSLSLEDLAATVRRTLDRMDMPVTDALVDDIRLELTAEGINRTVRLTLTPISTSVTRLGITVKQNVIVRDRATASEIVTQIEQSLLPLKSATR
jgi:hypothetical protein